MYGMMRNLPALAAVLTVATLITWWATGAHPYTKFEDITQEQVPADEDDPFAEAGFYDALTVLGRSFVSDLLDSGADVSIKKTLTKDVFYFGLLPTPQSLFDKHLLSLVSVVLPAWLIVGGFALVRWRIRRRASTIPVFSVSYSDQFPS